MIFLNIKIFLASLLLSLLLPAKDNSKTDNFIGNPVTSFTAVYGDPEEIDKRWIKDDISYYQYYSKGVSVSVQYDTINTVFYYFISKKFKPFSGNIDSLEINKNTTIQEVKNKFGSPDKSSVSVISSYGEFPGVEDTYWVYYKLGLGFSFFDKKLAIIRQFKRK